MYTSNLNNLILNSDSYKTSHWVQYPKGSEYLSSYIEARKGDYDVVFFGLQAFIKEYLSTPITHQDIDEAEMLIQAHGLLLGLISKGWIDTDNHAHTRANTSIRCRWSRFNLKGAHIKTIVIVGRTPSGKVR